LGGRRFRAILWVRSARGSRLVMIPTPNFDLVPSETDGIAVVLARACGLSLDAGLRRTLRGAILAAADALALDPWELVRRVLAEDADCVGALVEHSVVGETYFYRHPEQLLALRQHLFTAEGPLSIWSAGCASGEEPYTLAMALLEAGRAGRGDRILATDVSERMLERARAGVYGQWSLRRMPARLLDRYFTGSPVAKCVLPEVRQPVELRRHNLAVEPPPAGSFDLVICRNVLIYFESITAAEVLYRLLSAVRPGGLLALGPVEAPLAAPLELEWLDDLGARLLRRPLTANLEGFDSG
jgi:chemotaxis protein methyltransferase CheR